MKDHNWWVKALALDPSPCPLDIKVLIEQYADAVEAVDDAMYARRSDYEVEILSNNRASLRDELRQAIVDAIKAGK